MKQSKGKRLVLAAALAALALAGLFLWLGRRDIGYWLALREEFTLHSLRNAQGCPEYRHRATGIVMVVLPGGEFWMGSADDDDDAMDDERPRHRVALDPFLIAKFEVTQAEWEQVMGRDPAFHSGPRLPVEYVSWEECREFCERTGLELPSEAQWEYACRAGSQTPFATGRELSPDAANFDPPSPDRFRGRPVAVGSFPPNRFGLHDMHGNVGEWCADEYDPVFYGLPKASEKNPVNPHDARRPSGGKRVYRGGSWFDRASHCRSAFRGALDAEERRFSIGFRPASRKWGQRNGDIPHFRKK